MPEWQPTSVTPGTTNVRTTTAAAGNSRCIILRDPDRSLGRLQVTITPSGSSIAYEVPTLEIHGGVIQVAAGDVVTVTVIGAPASVGPYVYFACS